jgi:hypothetical protein
MEAEKNVVMAFEAMGISSNEAITFSINVLMIQFIHYDIDEEYVKKNIGQYI